MAAPASPPSAQTPTEAQQVINQPPHDGTFEVDDDDSALGSEFTSDWTSVTSSIYKGVFEHGRRYQALREGEYWSPADDQQFESVANNHLALLLLDQDEENQYFRSPINTEGSQILDIGTGDGAWAIDVADRYPGGEFMLNSQAKNHSLTKSQ